MCRYIGGIFSYSFLNIIFSGISCNPWSYESSLCQVWVITTKQLTLTTERKYIVIYRFITKSYIGSEWTGILFFQARCSTGSSKPSRTGQTLEITCECCPILAENRICGKDVKHKKFKNNFSWETSYKMSTWQTKKLYWFGTGSCIGDCVVEYWNSLAVMLSYIYIQSNEIHSVVALIKFLLVLRCQLYMFRSVTVHPQELLCRYCMCRLR